MKRLSIFLVFIFVFVINYGCSAHTTIEEGDALLRIHVRANSNSEQDQSVKLKVRDAVTQRLSSTMRNVQSLAQAKQTVSEERTTLTRIVNRVLMEQGKDYTCKVRLTNEYFPTRAYGNTIVESGYYDALIIELGKAEGDNWWCIIYPALCYNAQGNGSIVYKSRIAEWWNNIFGK